ncbi:MAG TPA: ATP-dependent DNA helicase [Bryobacteraceae bacterium]|nr:ATP-dependent DNA helicase [Bryobacteraceae bacterium]
MSQKTRAVSARSFFAPRGALSEWHPNYEFRPGQLEMAEAVEEAIAERKHLLVEAGTGTGKSLAYLVPAILAGKRIVVSTGTKNLQEQLYFKDIPFLQQHFANQLRVCYMKGRSNYVCRQKLYDAEREPILSGLEEIADFQIIRDWEKSTETGDRAEITTLPEQSSAWSKVDARGELCTGQKCAQFERCFITEMQRKALASDIIIVNHHLFFADLAVKENDFASIIPDYESVIFDEAHELEDIAGQYFGLSVSNHMIDDLRKDILSVARRKGLGTPELDRVLLQLGDATAQFFACFPPQEGRTGFTRRAAFVQEFEDLYRELLSSLEMTGVQLQMIRESMDEIVPLFGRARTLQDSLKQYLEGEAEDFVYWIERRGRGVYLQAVPIDVSALLRDKLFDKVPSTILTSATLSVGGGFEFVQKRLGIPYARTLNVASPFDFHQQALLYVPQHLPDPRDAGFVKAAAEEIIRLLHMSRGRAFVLCTSHQSMRALHDKVSFAIDYPVLLQGTGPRNALLEEFKRTPHAVLFATSSFWQGVDVQGDQLSCVIIDKLPFAVPSDPVVAARTEAVRRNGGEPFREYQIPQAAIALKQGFGRLIRSRTDRGVLALLDNRITRQRYGQIFFDSLPDYAFTTSIADVDEFFFRA